MESAKAAGLVDFDQQGVDWKNKAAETDVEVEVPEEAEDEEEEIAESKACAKLKGCAKGLGASKAPLERCDGGA